MPLHPGTHLPDVESDAAIEGGTGADADGGVEPRVLRAGRLEQDLDKGGVSLLRHQNVGAVGRLQHVDGVGREDAGRRRQTPVEADEDLACLCVWRRCQ